MSFGKIYERTFKGSMVGSGSTVYAVWSYVIAYLRPPGLVELNPKLLAAVIGASVEEIKKALEVLTSPDPESQCKEHEGRRLIKEGEFLYRSPTFEHYRNGIDSERRAANAERQKRWRDKQQQPKKPAAAPLTADDVPPDGIFDAPPSNGPA
jgi:hypothetical protein